MMEMATPSHPCHSGGAEGASACHQVSYTAEVEYFACGHCVLCAGMQAWNTRGVPLPVAVLDDVVEMLLRGLGLRRPCGPD